MQRESQLYASHTSIWNQGSWSTASENIDRISIPVFVPTKRARKYLDSVESNDETQNIAERDIRVESKEGGIEDLLEHMESISHQG